MQEIAPGLWHWSARHEHIHAEVSSYYLLDERVLIDPMIPAEGLAWFESRGAPEHVLLSNRHHDRDSWRLREAFGCTVHCIANGCYELEGRGPAEAVRVRRRTARRCRRLRGRRDLPRRDRAAHPGPRCARVRGRRRPLAGPGRADVRSRPAHGHPEQTKAGLRDSYRRLLGARLRAAAPGPRRAGHRRRQGRAPCVREPRRIARSLLGWTIRSCP